MARQNSSSKPASPKGSAASLIGDPEGVHERSWWTTLPGVLTGTAAVITAITGLVVVFVPRTPIDRPSATPQAPQAAATPSSPPPAVIQSAALPSASRVPLPKIVLDGLSEVSFDKHRPSTYSILSIETQLRTPAHYRLRVKVRLLTRTGMDMNFWDSAFRLLIDGLPTAPDSNLSELVPGNAAKDGEVTFQVPYGAQTLALRVFHYDEMAELPLAFVPREAPAKPDQAQPGGQSVKTGDIGTGAQVKILQKQ